jgi:hypothetical protein
MNLQIKDGKRHNRTLDINGFVKPSGTIVASVTNDKNETYFVQVRTDGTHTCKHIVNGKRVSCLGHFHTGRCYHVNAVIAAALPQVEEIDTTLVAEAMADADTAVRMNEQQAVRDAQCNPYDVLAEQKYIARVETRDDGLTTVYGTNGCTTIGSDRDEAVKLHIHYAWWATELKRRNEEWQRYQNYELGIQGLGA